MAVNIIWSPNAQKKLNAIVGYIAEEWTEKEAITFVKRVNKVLQQISNYPQSFPQSNKQNKIRKCVISKQTTLFFVFNDDHVNLLTFFDTRQNPDGLTL